MAEHVVEVTTDNFKEAVIDASFQQPVLVDFWADWCEPCKQLGPVLERLAGEYRGAFKLAKVDCEKEQLLAQQIGVRSLPTVLLVKEGQPLDQFTGALPESQLREWLGRYIEAPEADPAELGREALAAGDFATAVTHLRRAQQARPDDPEVTIDLARALQRSGAAEEALKIVEALPDEARQDARVKGILAARAFAERLAEWPEAATLARRLEADPEDSEARYGLALHQLVAGDYEAALEHLLWLVRNDRAYGEDAGRNTLLEAFDLLGPEDPLARRFRARLFQSLY